MKKTTFLIALVFIGSALFAQKKTTTSGVINFDASTTLDAMPKAENKTVVAALEPKTGLIAFEAIVKSFSFVNPMMQDHFNSDKWLDSDKFPTAIFKGKITNLAAVNFKADGTYSTNVTGDLTIHGITKPVTAVGSVVVTGKEIAADATFTIKLADFGITSKAIDAGKVTNVPKITVAVNFK